MRNRIATTHLLILFLLLTACTKPTEIVFTHGPDDSGTLAQLIADFNAQHKGDIHVTWQEGARLSNEYYRELEKAFLSGTSEIDVLSADVVWTSSFAEHGWVEQLSQPFFADYEPADFVVEALNSASYRSEVWGVPWYTDLGILFYRKDLLQEHGFHHPPVTWTDLIIMADSIQRNTFIKYGYVFQGANYEGGVANACEFIWNAGGQILVGDLSIDLDEPEPPLLSINSQEAIKGIESAQNLIASGIAPPDTYLYKEAETLATFKNGDAVFMRSWPTAYHQILASDAPITAADLGVAPLPVSERGNRSYSCLGGWNLMINASTSAAEKEAAWTFIRFLTAEQQQRTLARKGGNLPTLRSLYEDQALIAAVPAIGLAKQVMPNARLRPLTPHYMELAPDIAWAFSEALQGNLSAVAAVESIEGLFLSQVVTNRE
ncbi:MAG: ABC transporter substrate-binding protein [Bacteroidetes bacterium]|nr:MAG: ABC transporter substrate-binding protein [Bacteroidota bacterium]